MLLHQILILTLVATIAIGQDEAGWDKAYQVLKSSFDTFIQKYQNICTLAGNTLEKENFYDTWKNANENQTYQSDMYGFYTITRETIQKITTNFKLNVTTDNIQTKITDALSTLCNAINSDQNEYMEQFQYNKLPLRNYFAMRYTGKFAIKQPPFDSVCPSTKPQSNIQTNSYDTKTDER